MLKVDLQLFSNTKNKKQKMPQGAVDNFVSKTSYGNGNTPTYVNYTNNYSGTLASTDPRFKAPTTTTTPKYASQNSDAMRNIYNTIMNNGGSAEQAQNAIKNTFGVSNYYLSDNAYARNPGMPMNGKLINKRGEDATDYYNLLKMFGGKLPGLGSYGGIGGSYGGGGLSHIGPFQASDSYNQAMAYTNSLLEKLNNGRTSYSDKVDAMMSKIENRAAFSYDMDKDPMFQSYLSSMMDKGKLAMMDTIGQASALTGGYGSTYATGAANGAYNNYISEAYDNVKDYYGMALDAYNTETSNLYNQLGMYRDADESEYSRLYNAYNANFAMANDMYGKEYSNYWDTANYNLGVDQYNSDLAYKYANLNADIAYRNASLQQNAMSDYYNFMLKSMDSGSGSGSDGGSGSGSDGALKNFLTASNNKDALSMLSNLYFQYGDKEGSQYDMALQNLYEQGYDPAQVDQYIKDQVGNYYGATTEKTTNKFGKKKDMYTVTLPTGATREVSYQEYQNLLKKYPNLKVAK